MGSVKMRRVAAADAAAERVRKERRDGDRIGLVGMVTSTGSSYRRLGFRLLAISWRRSVRLGLGNGAYDPWHGRAGPLSDRFGERRGRCWVFRCPTLPSPIRQNGR